MNFSDFLNKWVYSDKWSMLNKQCTVTFSGGNCVIRTQEKENPFIYAITVPMCSEAYNGIFDTEYWSEVDTFLEKHFKIK